MPLPGLSTDGDADRLKIFPAGPEAFTPYGERLASVFNRDLLQGLEILLDVGPLETVSAV